MEDLEKIIRALLEDNVRHLPHYALNGLFEEIFLSIPESFSHAEEELLKELKYLLNCSPRCRAFIEEFLA